VGAVSKITNRLANGRWAGDNQIEGVATVWQSRAPGVLLK